MAYYYYDLLFVFVFSLSLFSLFVFAVFFFHLPECGTSSMFRAGLILCDISGLIENLLGSSLFSRVTKNYYSFKYFFDRAYQIPWQSKRKSYWVNKLRFSLSHSLNPLSVRLLCLAFGIVDMHSALADSTDHFISYVFPYRMEWEQSETKTHFSERCNFSHTFEGVFTQPTQHTQYRWRQRERKSERNGFAYQWPPEFKFETNRTTEKKLRRSLGLRVCVDWVTSYLVFVLWCVHVYVCSPINSRRRRRFRCRCRRRVWRWASETYHDEMVSEHTRFVCIGMENRLRLCMSARFKITFEPESWWWPNKVTFIECVPRFVFDQVRISRMCMGNVVAACDCQHISITLSRMPSSIPTSTTNSLVYRTQRNLRAARTIRYTRAWCCLCFTALIACGVSGAAYYSFESLAMLLTWLLRRSVQ